MKIMIKRMYIYGLNLDLNKSLYKNPYLKDLSNALENYFIINSTKNKLGVLDLFKYIKNTNYFYFNWLEDLPSRKLGIIQSIIFILFLFFMPSSKKIIYTIHNKISHKHEYLKLKVFIFKYLLKRADIVIIHTKYTIDFLNSINININDNKILYFPHPMKPINITYDLTKKNIDILIWGSVLPYKNIESFLNYAVKNKLNYSISVVGKFFDGEYFKILSKYQNENISIENKFVDINDLPDLISSARIVLFTYKDDTVLNSGALIDTLRFNQCVLAPNFGSFKELSEFGLINVYNNLQELENKIDNLLGNKINNTDLIETYYKKYNWDTFAKSLWQKLVSFDNIKS